MTFENFSYESVTVIRRSGVRAKVKTKISCPILNIKLKNWSGFVESTLSYENHRLLISKEGSVFNLEGSEMQTDLSGCQAPIGANLLFKDEIKKWIASDEGEGFLVSEAINFGQEFIDDEWEKIKEKDLKINLLGNEIRIEVADLKFFEDHIKSLGLVTSKSEKTEYTLLLPEGALEREFEKPVVITPKSFFSKLVPDFVKEASINLNFTRSDIPGVDFLFGSRFIQFFVWSDLLNFKKSADFKAELSILESDVELKNLSEQGFVYDVNGRHNVLMSFLNSKGSGFPYMNFNGGLKAKLIFNLNSDGLGVQLSKPKITAKSSWHPLMSKWRKSKPSGKPWMGVILPRVEDGLSDTDLSYSWDQLGVGGLFQNVRIKEESDFHQIEIDFEDLYSI
jgi:hypothetical protein